MEHEQYNVLRIIAKDLKYLSTCTCLVAHSSEVDGLERHYTER